jgi:hypothetical protein
MLLNWFNSFLILFVKNKKKLAYDNVSVLNMDVCYMFFFDIMEEING